MDSYLFYLKYKVIKLAPAIFTDNLMAVISSGCDVIWDYTFTNEDYYDCFFNTYGVEIIFDIQDIVEPWYETDIDCPVMWHVSEETLSKVLYYFKTKFGEKSDEEAEIYFLIYCSAMIFLALNYYNRGVTTALTIVFSEVYSFACSYLERMNFQCELMLSFTDSEDSSDSEDFIC